MERTNAELIKELRYTANIMNGGAEPAAVSLILEAAAVIENFEKMRKLGAGVHDKSRVRVMTAEQKEYASLYDDGYTVSEIARMKQKNPSTVSRVLRRARTKKCPFSPDCCLCPLDECAIDESVASLVNNGDVGDGRIRKIDYLET